MSSCLLPFLIYNIIFYSAKSEKRLLDLKCRSCVYWIFSSLYQTLCYPSNSLCCMWEWKMLKIEINVFKVSSQIQSPEWRIKLTLHRVNIPACQPMLPGVPVRQPCAGVNFIPPVRNYEFGFRTRHIGGHWGNTSAISRTSNIYKGAVTVIW